MKLGLDNDYKKVFVHTVESRNKKKNTFLFSLSVWNNSLLFCILFSKKLSVSVSYKVVFYMRDSTVFVR